MLTNKNLKGKMSTEFFAPFFEKKSNLWGFHTYGQQAYPSNLRAIVVPDTTTRQLGCFIEERRRTHNKLHILWIFR